MLSLNRIHHVAIICTDYEVSKKFYTEILGFKIIKETLRAERKSYKLDLMVGQLYQIELFSFPDPPARNSRPEAAGLRHIAFEVDDIDASVQFLWANDIVTEPVRTDEITGKRFIFFADPDNLPIELYEK